MLYSFSESLTDQLVAAMTSSGDGVRQKILVEQRGSGKGGRKRRDGREWRNRREGLRK
jgi:hypothetical protein